MVDNFDIILPLLSFNNKNEFYFLQIIQRKKDGNEGVHVRSGYRLIKSYYVYSKEDLIGLKDRIKELCINNNARAYINLNVRNAKEVALTCISKYSELILNDNSFMGNNIWDSSCGSTHARNYKLLWTVDIDDISYLEKYKEVIMSCRGSENRIVCSIPTVHGVHLITHGFDTKQYAEKLKLDNIPVADIHKNNPTLLYYNDIFSKQE